VSEKFGSELESTRQTQRLTVGNHGNGNSGLRLFAKPGLAFVSGKVADGFDSSGIQGVVHQSAPQGNYLPLLSSGVSDRAGAQNKRVFVTEKTQACSPGKHRCTSVQTERTTIKFKTEVACLASS